MGWPAASLWVLVRLRPTLGSLPVADIARKVGLSVTPCWRRIQRMQESGVIRQRVALLDAQKLGVGMSVFVAVRTDQHNADWLSQFATMVSAMACSVAFRY